jgi:hypothetical protein
MRELRDELQRRGFVVTSRWIDGGHELTKEGSTQAAHEERKRFAEEDWSDMLAADVVVSFTEEPRKTNTRGGRHVEFGGALATGKRCVVIGWRENVFHCLDGITFFDSHWDWLRSLDNESADVAVPAPAEPPRSPCHNMPVIAGHCILCKQLAETVPVPQTEALIEQAATRCDVYAHQLRSIREFAVAAGVEVLAAEIRALATESAPPSVESVLAELREMFPNTYCYIRSNGSGHVRFDNGEIYTTQGVEIHVQRRKDDDLHFNYGTLTEAMQQVRQWKENQP